MLGDALILFPVFDLNTNDKKVQFPYGNWNRFQNGNKIIFDNENMTVELSGEYEDIHLFIRGGFIVPFQDCFGKTYIKNTHYLLQEKINFVINPSKENNAKGDVIFDNDEIDSLERKKFMRVFIEFKGNEGKIIFNAEKNFLVDYLFKDNIIGIIKILNQNEQKYSKFNIILNDNKTFTNSINFNNEIYILNLTNFNIKIENIFEINLLK
jgi:alpha-glucosidase (family GH31 glycosyl hydrolase)